MTAGGGTRRVVRTVALLGCASTLVSAFAALLLISPAQADDTQTNDNRYSLNAEGDGMYVTLYDGSLPASPNVDFSPYSAQSAINSQGASTGFAGLPYGGKTAETLPGTINGLAGGNFPPVPAFPGYVATSYPGHKSESQKQGPYQVASDSQQYASKATAGSGASADNGTSHQQVFSVSDVIAAGDGSTKAHANAGVVGLNFGPIEALNVSSDLLMTSNGRGDPKVIQSDNLGSFTALGFKIGITKEGFSVLGANLPVPTNVILDNINTALGAQGLQVKVIPGSTTRDNGTGATTVTSGSVQITNARDVPTQGATFMTYTFGRSVVSTVNVASPSSPLAGNIAPVDSSGDVAGAEGDASGGSGGLATDPGPGGIVSGPGTTGGLEVPPPTIDTGEGQRHLSSGTPRTLGYLASSSFTGTEVTSLYMVLVLAGLGVLGGQQVFRSIGVRLKLRAAAQAT